jgi:hypothetical protein
VLLYRESDRTWSPAEVADELKIAPQSAGMRLFLLASAGLLSSSGSPDLRYGYAADEALDHWARLIAEAWKRDRRGLYALVPGGQASDPAKQFADAFKVRKP